MEAAYDEIIEFIAAGTTPSRVVAFQPSEESKHRVQELIHQEKEGTLSADDKRQLDHFLQIEHLMRLAKARARMHLTNE